MWHVRNKSVADLTVAAEAYHCEDSPWRIVSIPTEKFRQQNSIFHEFYAHLRSRGVDASDFSFEQVLRRDLALLQLHFPEHFATNYAPLAALVRSAGLLSSVLLCKARGVPIVWTVHNVAVFEARNMPLYRLLMVALTRLIDGYIFLSESSKQDFHRRFPNVRPPASALIPHPAYPIEVAPLPPEGPIVLAMLGEQKTYKEPLASLRLYEIARSLIDCRLMVAGTVHDPERFRSALAGREVEWIDRRLDDAELERAAKRAHFALLPYSTITNSGAALYALSCGRVIVTSPLPLFYELRKIFGPAWVRIADGGERSAEFWSLPSHEDFLALKQTLARISLDAIATRHRAFFESLIKARAA